MLRFDGRWCAAAAVSLAACSLFADLDALENGRDTNSNDATVAEPSDATVTDRTSEGGAREDARSDAALEDAADDAPAPPAPLRFCAQAQAGLAAEETFVFCDDFDAPERFSLDEEGWTRPSTGVAGITEELFFSPPRAGVVSFGTDDGGPGRGASGVQVAFPRERRFLVARMRLRPHTGYAGNVLNVDLLDACPSVYYALDGRIGTSCPVPDPPARAGTLPTERWTLVVLTLERGSSQVRVYGRLDVGEGVGTVSTSFALAATDAGGGAVGEVVRFSVGQDVGSGAGNGVLEFDDVLVTTR